MAEEAEKTESTEVTTEEKTEAGTKENTGTESTTESTESDWRAAIKDEAARKFAEDSPDLEHLAKRAFDMRQKISSAIVKPGKDAKPEEIAAYRKALDIPAEAKEYLNGVQRPEHISEEDWKSERVQGLLGSFAERMHAKGAPKAAVQEAIAFELEVEANLLKAQAEEDKKFAEASESALKEKWGPEFSKNKEFANRAVEKLFGDSFEKASKLTDSAGRFVLDNPVFIEAFAAIGREMGEGSLGGAMTDSERDTLDDQIRNVRKEIETAQVERDSKRANSLYQKEQALLAKQKGSKPIVGAGRAA